jgi:hypothetical protein
MMPRMRPLRHRMGVMCGSFVSERVEVRKPFKMPHRSGGKACGGRRSEQRPVNGTDEAGAERGRAGRRSRGCQGRAGARSCPPRSGLVQWRFFEGQKRHFSVTGAGVSKHKPSNWLPLCRPTFWRPRARENVGRHFRARTFFDVTRRGRVRPDAADLMTCGRHGEAAQRATLPWRAVFLYLDASVYAGLRQHTRATY